MFCDYEGYLHIWFSWGSIKNSPLNKYKFVRKDIQIFSIGVGEKIDMVKVPAA